MISEWVATAVTEHICSKIGQLFNFSKSIQISGNYVCLRKLLSSLILHSGTGTADFTGASLCLVERLTFLPGAFKRLSKTTPALFCSSLVGVLSRYSLLPSSRLRSLLRRVVDIHSF